VWQAVLDHRRHLEEQGSLAVRRAQQQQDWMWALVDDQLQDDVRRSPGVRAQRDAIEAAVRSGETSAVEAAARVLELFADDLRARSGDHGA
jgi:LAO/AO transport system kinase